MTLSQQSRRRMTVVLLAGLSVGCAKSEPTAPATSAPAAAETTAGVETIPTVEPTTPATPDEPTGASAADIAATGITITKAAFGKLPDGKEVDLFTCTNKKGCELKLTSYGARIVALKVPDREGKSENVTLGFDTLDGYLQHTAYFGCTVGRYANRIAQGKFSIDGDEFTLAKNNGENHLHGGVRGFDKVVWTAEQVVQDGSAGIKFSYFSNDGEEGYPGNMHISVTYLLAPDDNDVKIDYEATTDSPTVVNLTNHAYWNLAGTGDVLDHELMLAAARLLPVDKGLIPTGEIADVADTPFDFREAKAIGSRIDKLPPDGDDPGGYDHCYVLDSDNGSLKLAARAKHPGSGRVMEVHTTQPGIQLYTGNFLNGDAANGGHKKHAAFCLETQHFPDSPNRPEFPTTRLESGETYKQTTVHKFRTE